MRLARHRLGRPEACGPRLVAHRLVAHLFRSSCLRLSPLEVARPALEGDTRAKNRRNWITRGASFCPNVVVKSLRHAPGVSVALNRNRDARASRTDNQDHLQPTAKVLLPDRARAGGHDGFSFR